MQKIEVDDDVFALLQKHAMPFVDTPNSTLRRLLGIDIMSTFAEGTQTADKLMGRLRSARSRLKAPKADLQVLIQAGFVRNGDKLHFIDYQGNQVPKIEAIVSGSNLLYEGQYYSMSSLAQKCLADIGFESSAVRGPAHWVTEAGKSIRDLWKQHLNKNAID